MITLRLFRESELDWFDGLADRDEDPFSFFGLRSGARVRRLFAENGLVDPSAEGGGTVAVDLDGTVIGDVQWHPVRYGPPPTPVAFNIGIRLARSHRGQGHGSTAQRLLAEYLFATYPVHRLEASTDVTNVPEQRALAKAGFRREGVLRGAQFRNGEHHDLVQFSRLRGDDPAHGSAT